MTTAGDRDPARRWARVCAVLDAVLDAASGERGRILDERCAGDADLRAEVEALLAAEAEGERLEIPVVERAGGLVGSIDASPPAPDRSVGDTIGPWRLVRELGRGGMGSVWLAERADGAFEQRVALKLLKRGLDSDAILERFLAERQILARLQHPHIAHLVDGGLAPDGRPYFAMELVEGEPITGWCDQRALPVRGRIDLLLAVADAVQHAHRQLVVHRDLKPSNILVTPQGEAKLLDFGIAKLLDAEASRAEAQTLTQLGIRLLTPEYAAPEQLRGDAVTTSTDVYALGVLLYELLAGQRPPAASPDGKLPPRPSTRIESTAAQARATTPERLRRALRGDLDTIALRALHPEPERRYATADALGADLRRHLNREPVLARPDSLRYRTGRFIARNRLAVAAAALVALTLVGGIVATSWQAREARQQARRAEQVKDFLVTVFEAGGPQEWRGREPTARELLDAGARRVDEELTGDPALHAEMLAVIGSLYVDQGRLDGAETLLSRSLEERRRHAGEETADYADSLQRWSALLYAKGDLEASARFARRAADIYGHELGNHPQTATALGRLSLARLGMGETDQAVALYRDALDIRRAALGSRHPDVANDMHVLGSLLVEQERFDEAERLFETSLAIYREAYGPDSVRYASGLNAQALLLQKRGRIERAASAFGQAASVYRKAGDTTSLEDALSHWGSALCRLGRFDEGIGRQREALSLLEQGDAAVSRRIGIRLVGIGGCMVDAGRATEAEPVLRKGLAKVLQDVGPKHVWTPIALHALGECLLELGRAAQARPLLERANQLSEQLFGADDAGTLETVRTLARLRFESGEQTQGLQSSRRVFERLQQLHGPRDPRTAAAALDLASLELRADAPSSAEPLLRGLASAFDTLDDRPRSLEARMLYAIALTRLGHKDPGITLLRRTLSEHVSMYGKDNPKTRYAERHLAEASTST